ncbi:hypothetical protein WICPIJ_003780 [Wickerhamomyces pijperi]|uniref:Uncharacterized protein n=1 Tax=Wickerhamomyces pijperi TaxID=599730 RepID=A0A9P8TNX2_WICPI|nr:hypothetical protein WICPIJ_003780 [Wickerhamomyces pijperi]
MRNFSVLMILGEAIVLILDFKSLNKWIPRLARRDVSVLLKEESQPVQIALMLYFVVVAVVDAVTFVGSGDTETVASFLAFFVAGCLTLASASCRISFSSSVKLAFNSSSVPDSLALFNSLVIFSTLILFLLAATSSALTLVEPEEAVPASSMISSRTTSWFGLIGDNARLVVAVGRLIEFCLTAVALVLASIDESTVLALRISVVMTAPADWIQDLTLIEDEDSWSCKSEPKYTAKPFMGCSERWDFCSLFTCSVACFVNPVRNHNGDTWLFDGVYHDTAIVIQIRGDQMCDEFVQSFRKTTT